MAGDQETREVYAASMEAVAESIRITITLASLIAESVVRAREARLRREAEASRVRARWAAEQLKAERAEAEPLLRQAWQESFWERADPRQIGLSWQAAAEWAAMDPYAAATLEHLKGQLKEHLDVVVPDWPVGGGELARMMLLASEDLKETIQEHLAARGEHQVAYVVIIRDVRDPHQVLHQVALVADVGMMAQAVAAEQFLAWQTDHPDSEVAFLAVEVVEVGDSTIEETAGQVPAAVLRGADAQPLWEEHLRWRDAVVAGEVDASGLEEAYAVGEVLRTAGEEQDTTALTLRLAEAHARVRGEDPAYVEQAVRTMTALDEDWWRTASAPEIAGVWQDVSRWPEGSRTRQATQTFLQDAIEDRHGVAVPEDADAKLVADVLGGPAGTEPAMPLTEQARQIAAEARRRYAQSWDQVNESFRMDVAARTETGLSDEERAELRENAARLRLSARAERSVATRLSGAGWALEKRAEAAIEEALEEGTPESLTRLREEFTRRWGRTPREAATLGTPVAEAGRTVGHPAIQVAGRGRTPLTKTDLNTGPAPARAPKKPPLAAPARERAHGRG